MASKPKDLSNQTFGRLTILQMLPIKNHRAMWLCKCECGIIKPISSKGLLKGTTKSCGCLGKEKRIKGSTTHGMGNKSPEYNTWVHIKDRCLNPKNNAFPWYGGRGIGVYPEWVNDFKAFFDYVGKRPSPKHSLDRYPNNDGNYEPNNVRWATFKQQQGNTSKNVIIHFNGTDMVQLDFAKMLGIANETLRMHLKNGRTPAQIFDHFKYKKDNNITKPIPFQLFD